PPPPAMHPWAPAPPPQAHPQPASAWPPVAQHKRRLLVGRLTGAIRKLFSHRPKPRPPEATSTDPLRRPDAAQTDATSPQAAASVGALNAHQLRLIIGGQQLLGEVSFTAEPGTITAVVGPSEATTSALINVLSGAVQPSFGAVTVEGHDVHAEDLHSRIG